MLNRCACKRYTDYGSICLSCSMAATKTAEVEEFDYDDLFDDEEEEEITPPNKATG